MPSFALGATPTPDGAAAATFFRDWFGNESRLFSVITLIDPDKRAAARGRTEHLHEPPVTFREMFEDRPLDELVYLKDQRWNLYAGVGLMTEAPPPGRKGGKKDIVRVPGVWVDLDVGKDGFFRDEEHALSLLRSVRPYPTIVVATGTGGVHGYWKVAGGLGPQEAEELTTAWWCLLTAEADAKIDKLTNCDRVMKLPGSIRWEKDPGDQPALVRLLYSSPETIPASELVRVSEPALQAHRDRIKRQVDQVYAGRAAAAQLTAHERTRAGRWGQMLSIASLEDEFNESHTWHEILEPLGWTDIGQDSDGRTLWARPGQKDDAKYKSAATDYQGSHVMTLFSDSPDTGLRDLAGTEIPLTKYRVWVQTRYNGDESAYVRHALGLDSL